jgi:hypothetical protein
VRSVQETPTSRSDYALLSATYMSLLGGLAAAQQRRGRSAELIAPGEIVPLAAATFAMSKLVVHEKVETWMRAPFVEERPDGRRPKGRRLRYAVGELLTCTRCTGAWSALALVALRVHAPQAGRIVTTVLATSAGNDFAQSAFSLLCGAATRTDRQAEAVGRELSGNGAGHPRGASASSRA